MRGGGQLKPAFAGYWEEVQNPYGDEEVFPSNPNYDAWKQEATDRYDGTTSVVEDTYTNQWLHYDFSDDWYKTHGVLAGFSGPAEAAVYSAGGAASVVDVGKRMTKYHWVRDLDPNTWEPDLNDNPPDFLIVKVIGNIKVLICSDLSNQVRNVTKEHVTTSLMGESDAVESSVPSGDAVYSAFDNNKTKLFAIPTKGQDYVDGPIVNYGVSAQLDDDRILGGSPDTYLLGEIDIFLGYNPQIDTRKLTLHRANAINETTDEDGVTHGDTTYSYANYTDNVNWYLVENHQTFTPTFEGSWTGGTTSPDVTWNWTPVANFLNPSPTKVEGVFTPIGGNMHYNSYAPQGWEGSATGTQTVNVTYNAKDNTDGATATTTYVLTVHDAWENLRSDPDQSPIVESLYFPPNASSGNQWVENPNGPDGATGTWSHSIDVSHTFDSSISGGFTLEDFANLGVTFTQSTSQSIGTQFGSTSPPIPTGKHCYPYVRLQWNRNYYLVDHYVPAGHDINSARANSNGQTDATHDGSWEQWLDDYQGGYSVGWSPMYRIDDFNGDGLPD